MPRIARIKSQSNIYHIMIRGNNQQDIFTDDEKFLAILYDYRQKIEWAIYAYCLMGNQVYLLLPLTSIAVFGSIFLSKSWLKLTGLYPYWIQITIERLRNLINLIRE